MTAAPAGTAGTPTAGTPTAGTPTAGTPTAGTPAPSTAGTPTAGGPAGAADGPAAGLTRVRAAVAAACADAGRDASSVALVAASKTVPPEVLERTIAAGHLLYGENRVQEARAKWPELRERHPEVSLHLIGALQSNKVRDAVALVDAVHSVDRPSLCAALARECSRVGRQPQLFVQVNTGEAQKSGVAPEQLDELLTACRRTYELEVSGLMCIPPVEGPPELHFRRLAVIAAGHGLPLLSMGMSADYAAAIRCGATHVRVGSALFGSRG